MTPFKNRNKSELNVYWCTNKSDDYLDSIMEKLAGEENGEASKKVYILGRYKHIEPENLQEIKHKHRRRYDISYHTAHSSKGEEADHVIVLGLDSGRYGFPSEIEDDPLLNMVLTKSDDYPFSEERRLFYVAMTRTKEKLFLVSSVSNRSSFVVELLDDNPNSIIEINAKYEDFKLCPYCKVGSIVERNRRRDNHQFYGCSNFPYCKFNANTLNCIPNVTHEQRHPVRPHRVQKDGFACGENVEHSKFGLGRVKEYLDLGENSIVVVQFNSGKTKSLMVQYAKLKRVN